MLLFLFLFVWCIQVIQIVTLSILVGEIIEIDCNVRMIIESYPETSVLVHVFIPKKADPKSIGSLD